MGDVMSTHTIRIAVEDDLEEIAILFFDTVTTINANDYNEEEIKLWSTRDIVFWKRRFSEQYFIVAEEQDNNQKKITGFASLTDRGYIDFMYVHKDYQRRGVALKLLSSLETCAVDNGLREIQSHVSITAKPFFLKHGFTVMKKNKLTNSIANFPMLKVF